MAAHSPNKVGTQAHREERKGAPATAELEHIEAVREAQLVTVHLCTQTPRGVGRKRTQQWPPAEVTA